MAHTCAGCNQIIVAQFATSASGRAYHPEHFNCRKCIKPLKANEKYFENSDGAFCQHCHTQYYTHKCAFCREPIEGETVLALNNRYHPHHFRCSTCDTQLTADKFFSQGQTLFCQTHAPGQVPETICYGCQSGINSTSCKKAMGKTFHPGCFKCATCSKALSDNFFDIRGRPYCNVCAMKAI